MKRTLLLLLASLTAMVALLLPTLGSGATQTVRVKEFDGKISLSARPKAGTVRFVVRNAGSDEHNFMLRGGGKRWGTRILAGGGSATVVAKLKKGVRYSYWCAVSDHASEGMRGSFRTR
jgi:uncharacterized cupredoxin-like copper-binding protein